MTLTFKDGHFILRVLSQAEKQKLVKTAEWTRLTGRLFQTSSLKAAVIFKRHSDLLAKRVFRRTLNQPYDLPILPQLSFLDKHQIEGVKWILSRSRSYLAHAPGAGKTAQVIIASMLARGAGQTVFIVPPDLTENWYREILKFTEMLNPRSWPTISIVPRSDKQDLMNWRAEFIIAPDSLIGTKWVQENLNKLFIKFLAVDESSRLKENASLRSRAFYGGAYKKQSFEGLFQDAAYTVFMDGSPMPNRPMELWAPTYALDPEALDCMTQIEFGQRYCGGKINDMGHWEFKHSTREVELRQRLQERFMHVITEDELDHPERKRSMVFLNEDVRSNEHKAWERRNLSKLDVNSIDEESSQGDLATFRRELGIRKVPWITKYVSRILDDKNESILLFVWHREVALELAKRLVKYDIAVVMGGTKNAEREDIFRRFQAGKLKGIIGNISAMGRGHNLQKADRAIFGEFSWSSESNKQCEKRASRRGRAAWDVVKCDYLVAPNSMDEKVLNALFTKENRIKRVIG